MMQISGLLNLPFKLEEMISLWILHCYICLLLLTGFLSSWKRYFLGETRNNPVVPPLVDQDSKSLSGHIRAEETETVPPSLTSQPWTVPPSLSSQQWTLPPSLISQPWTAAVKMKCCSQNYLLFHCRKKWYLMYWLRSPVWWSQTQKCRKLKGSCTTTCIEVPCISYMCVYFRQQLGIRLLFS